MALLFLFGLFFTQSALKIHRFHIGHLTNHRSKSADGKPRIQSAQLYYAISHKDLSFHGFWYPWESQNQSPSDTEGQLHVHHSLAHFLTPSWHSTVKTQQCSSLFCSSHFLWSHMEAFTFTHAYIHSFSVWFLSPPHSQKDFR